jgi:hypothetical protein
MLPFHLCSQQACRRSGGIAPLRLPLCLAIVAITAIGPGGHSVRGAELDLRPAKIVHPPDLTLSERKAVQVLIEEVEKRTLIRWEASSTWPPDATPVIAVGPLGSLKAFAGPFSQELGATTGGIGAEGYRISVQKGERAAPAVFVLGQDARGVLFGVGRLLRELHLTRGKAILDDRITISTSPKYPLRGHQLGYRPKTNSYDGWNAAVWDQYIRDLAVFGTNAIELIPPRSDDAADSLHFPLPPMDMMVAMSKLLDDYGLDVWIWYPAMDRDYSDPQTVAFALNEWGEVFKKLPRIDAIFVPGGDPGHTQPKYLLALLEKQTAVLHRYHPKAQMWVSPQSFSKAWMDEFCDILQKEQPSWLSGVVFGPQVRVSLPQLREMIPRRYPIRRYPDITHSLRCQYPVPDWDLALALTEGREGINPRPFGQAQIFRAFQDHAIGSITYSEGCNDDVNKIVWSCLGWDPNADIVAILRDYSQYFLGPRYREDFAQGLLALERNWQGPLLTNAAVDTTLGQFRALEKAASAHDLLNWRFQQALYRAYFDAYERSRLVYETALEERALDKLRAAREIGSVLAIGQAEGILDLALTQRVGLPLRARVFELAEALYQSIRMQLSVPRYKAIAVGRGANLDTIDVPLNNSGWLKQRFAALRALSLEAERLRGIDEILNWTNPGPGGFYDDLGNPVGQPHLVRGRSYAQDPAFLESAMVAFDYASGWRLSWCRHAATWNETPLQMRYEHLDPRAQYKIRIVYAGDMWKVPVRLSANRSIEVHPFLQKPYPPRPIEFDIPRQATAQGSLELSWHAEPGRGGNGRGCQVAEVWLIKN